MKITITDQNQELILSDNELENENFVDVVFDDKVVTVPIDELYSATVAFLEKRDINLIKKQ